MEPTSRREDDTEQSLEAVTVIVAPNPSVMTGPGTNTYVVGSGPACVIDPAVDDDGYLEALLEVAVDVASILVTHRHPDHVGGVRAVVERTGANVLAFGPQAAGVDDVLPLGDEEVIEVGGARLIALHTPGHARDHLCFLLQGSNSLFSGDSILGEGTAVIAPPDGDMRAYIKSLERLRHLGVGRIYPGHFASIEDGAAAIDAYLVHRAEREAAILDALDRPSRVADVVARVYTDTPQHLHPIAVFQALAHLEALEQEGRAARVTGQGAEGLWARA